ncbi:carbohydrate kinase family protein [Candidatus Borrarchaeum sp.]|uniref:carbohydrate kinase family protein n=1 Tax=Candidatus Borrarchaeum sp. TaxID=2846742 RepID=UPI00258040E1|nr:PfkB family carbohydrate kinase [Candidatus Borrarchaeum sp.]
MYDLVVIAHFALDIITKNGENKPLRLGGPPLYCSIAAKRLGGRPGIISKVGEDFKEEFFLFFSGNNIDISGIKRCKGLTTRFKLEYKGEVRTEFLIAKSERIEIQDISEQFLDSQAFIISPIVDEIPLDTLKHVAKKGRGSIYLDPSGYIRSIAKNGSGRIFLTKWKDMADYLQYINVLKASVSEIEVLTNCNDLKLAAKEIEDLGVKIVIITEGSKGSYIQYKGEFFHIPSIKCSNAVDVTGAGDVYISAFALEFSKTKDAIRSGAFATAAVSSKIQGPGVSALKTRNEIEELASQLVTHISTL